MAKHIEGNETWLENHVDHHVRSHSHGMFI